MGLGYQRSEIQEQYNYYKRRNSRGEPIPENLD